MTNVAVADDVAWFRGFGWSPAAIAARLAVPVEVVLAMMKDYAPSEQEIFQIASAARREARLVYGRTVPQWKG